jgi:hypothetical protein
MNKEPGRGDSTKRTPASAKLQTKRIKKGRFNMKRNISLWSILLALALTGGLSAAAEQTLQLKPGDLKGAKGEAVIKEVAEGQKEITVRAGGLRPNSVYTLWFVNEKPKMDMAGVGKPDYDFTSDAQGNATYTAVVPAAELKKWQIIKVAYHPDRNPRNMRNITTGLEAPLP